jgi:hypothetical protein
MNLNERIQKFDEYLSSPEGKKSTEEYFQKIANKKAILEYQLEKFHNLYKDRLDEVIERVKNKYQSDVYRDREYRLGREPMEELYSFLFEYAQKYCKVCYEKQYDTDFSGSAMYYLGSYIIQVICGQGCFTSLVKQNNPPIITTGTNKMREFLREVNALCKKYQYTIQPSELVLHGQEPTISIIDSSEEFRVSFINGELIKN